MTHSILAMGAPRLSVVAKGYYPSCSQYPSKWWLRLCLLFCMLLNWWFQRTVNSKISLLRLQAISKFSGVVRGCLDCFPQMLNLNVFLCWYSSATFLLTHSGWAEAQIPHPKFTLQPQFCLWTQWLSQWSLPNQSSFSWPCGRLFQFQPRSSQNPCSRFFFHTIPRDLQIDSVLDSFALENTPGLWLNIVIVENGCLAASRPRPLEQALLFICTD